MRKRDVGVWHYPSQSFVWHCGCPGEKRVRIDVHDDLSNYAVYAGDREGPLFWPDQPPVPLSDWTIDLT